MATALCKLGRFSDIYNWILLNNVFNILVKQLKEKKYLL